MKKCEKCGLEYVEDYAFCPSCGGNLVEVEEPVPEETEEKATVRFCSECGTEIPEGFLFCPECGSQIDWDEEFDSEQEPTRVMTRGEDPADEYVELDSGPISWHEEESYEGSTPEPEPAPAAAAAAKAPKKKMSNQTKIIIGAVALAAIIAIAVVVSITSPRELVLNAGNPIEMYVGDEGTISISGEGLTDADYQTATWTSFNEDVLTVDHGAIKASYDSDSFYVTDDEFDEVDDDPCSCTTTVQAHIEKGMKKWDGEVSVKISLEPVEVKSGDIIKEPEDSKGSSLEVTPSDDYNSYIYLKSKTKESNDMSFIVKKGVKTTVSVPRDQYLLYWANGDAWYGGDYLFGPDTTYLKDNEEWDFDKYTWTFNMQAENGNMNSEDVSEDDFPEL